MIDVSSIIILSSNRFYCSILIIKTANRLFKKKVIEEELKELTEKRIKKNKRFWKIIKIMIINIDKTFF